jgi:hypothetical protein
MTIEGENNKIQNAIKADLQKSNFDLAVDYSEAGLDYFIDSEALKEIPVIKTVVGAIKGGMAVRDIFFAKKLMTFLREYHNGELAREKKDEFFEKFQRDPKYRESVVEHIVTLNERFITVEKSKVLSNLFQAHINGKFDWESFCELAECLDKIHTAGFKILDDSAKSSDPFHFKTHESDKDGGGLLFSAGICVVLGNHYGINAHGQYLYYYGIRGDINWEFPKNTEPEH